MNYYLAQAYGANAYNTQTYNGQASSNSNTATGTSTGTAGNNASGVAGKLTNTGFDVIVAVTLASAIICASLFVKLWRKPAKTPTPEN
jgi:hypothetical protein